MWPARATVGRQFLQMRMTAWRIFYAFTTRFFDRNRWFADDGVCQRRAGIYSSERSASVGCPAAHGARAVLGLAGWSDEPQLFLDDQPEVIAPEPPTWREFLKSLDAKDYTASGIKLRLEQIGFEPKVSTRVCYTDGATLKRFAVDRSRKEQAAAN